MRRLQSRRLHAMLCAALALTTAYVFGGLAQAQNHPSKSVRFIIPTGAGSQPDVVAHMHSERLSRRFGQQFLVENLS